MDRQLVSPLLIRPLQKASKLSSQTTYQHLTQFLPEIPLGPARTQLERLTDALGVEIGAIAPSEGDRREEQRKQERSRRIAEKKRQREEQKRLAEEAMLEGMLEEDLGHRETEGMDGEMESGAVHMDGEEAMDDRGDVEYGDVVNNDEDEPDEEERPQDKMEVDMGSEHAESSEEESDSESESEDEKCEWLSPDIHMRGC